MAKEPERLERFREYIARLDPTGRLKWDDRLYVEPPGRSLGDELALRLQLAPESSHLIVGGIGAGKTTQVRRALSQLEKTPDTKALYVDVSSRHDLDQDIEGVLLVLAGLALSRLVKAGDNNEVKVAQKAFREWAHGRSVFVSDSEHEDGDWDSSDHEPGYYVKRPGVIHPPLPPLGADTEERIDALKVLLARLPDGLRHVVVGFDALDRLSNMDRFRNVVAEDVRGLRAAGIGVIVVGPSRVIYGANRPLVDIFDRLHVQPALDVSTDEASAVFLNSILSKRADESVLPRDERGALVDWSGGTLRDLLSLAHNAVEEAFIDGRDAVNAEHVSRAADRFGRSMMIGLRPAELDTLRQLQRKHAFVPTDDEDMALLESRRVLEYRGVVTRYAVHPTIAPYLKSLGKH